MTGGTWVHFPICGASREVLTPELLREVFEIEAGVMLDANTGCPVVIPIRSLHAPVRTAEPPDGASMVTDSRHCLASLDVQRTTYALRTHVPVTPAFRRS